MKDYSKILRAYFKECNYTKEQINELLETNPFGVEFVRWENQKQIDNRTFAWAIKKLNLVRSSDAIYEFGIQGNLRVSELFANNSHFISTKDGRVNVSLPDSSILIINGVFLGMSDTIKKLKKSKKSFAIGLSTIDKDYYDKSKKYYQDIASKYGVSYYEDSETDQKTYMLYNKTSLR